MTRAPRGPPNQLCVVVDDFNSSVTPVQLHVVLAKPPNQLSVVLAWPASLAVSAPKLLGTDMKASAKELASKSALKAGDGHGPRPSLTVRLMTT